MSTDQVCPIKIDVMNQTKEEVAEAWKQIKQWYKDHPEAKKPWDEWVNRLPSPIIYERKK